MRNFRINPEGYTEPNRQPHYYPIGTALKFLQDESGRLKTVLKINVAFA